MCEEAVTGAKTRLLGIRVAMQATGVGATGLQRDYWCTTRGQAGCSRTKFGLAHVGSPTTWGGISCRGFCME